MISILMATFEDSFLSVFSTTVVVDAWCDCFSFGFPCYSVPILLSCNFFSVISIQNVPCCSFFFFFKKKRSLRVASHALPTRGLYRLVVGRSTNGRRSYASTTVQPGVANDRSIDRSVDRLPLIM